MERGLNTAAVRLVCVLVCLFAASFAQSKRLWVLQSGEIVEYDPTTFVAKQRVKAPAEAAQSPQGLSVNHLGQMLFTVPLSGSLSETDLTSANQVWFWNGQAATTLDRGLTRKTAPAGSNIAITESVPVAALSADGTRLFWFANQSRRLQRDNVDLSLTNTFLAWQTDLVDRYERDLSSSTLPECRCTTGSCSETCAYGDFWFPENGVSQFFLLTHLVEGQTQPEYKASFLYGPLADKWVATPISPPLERILDAASQGNVIVNAIPDTACCGWENESDDQTWLLTYGKPLAIFDERATYNNPNYDVSFYTSNARLSPDLGYVAMTIVSTAKPNTPIQLADEGQANVEESARIRKALAELPAVEVKNTSDPAKRVAYLPHATLVGWLSDKEVLIVEDHLLVAYHVVTGARRKSTIRVPDETYVFVR